MQAGKTMFPVLDGGLAIMIFIFSPLIPFL
jgi:hypothetical protein